MKADTRSRLTRAQVETSTLSHTRYTEAASGSLVGVVVWWVRVWRAVRRAVAAATQWVRETVTPAGWVVVFAVAVLLPVGLHFGWVELVIAGAIGALLLLIALPFLAGGRSYSIDFSLPVDRVVAGGEVVGTLRVTNTSHRLELPGRVDVPIGRGLLEVYVPLLRAGHVHDERVAVPAYRRGVLDVGPVTWVRTDPIGVLKREVAWAGIHRLFIHPVTVSIPSTSAGFVRDLEGSATSDLVDSDISFHAIREYAHGDSRRNIHWKSTAKTGTLMVRQFEETRRSRLAIVLSVNEHEYASDDEFEMAVSAAGSLGVRAIRDGRDVAVVASEEIPELVRGRVRSVRSLSVLSTRSLLDELSGVERSENTMPTEDVSMLASQVVPDISIAFIVCGSTMTPARLQSIALKFPINVQTVAVLCDPNSAPSYRELAGTGVLTIGVLDDFRSLLARRAG